MSEPRPPSDANDPPSAADWLRGLQRQMRSLNRCLGRATDLAADLLFDLEQRIKDPRAGSIRRPRVCRYRRKKSVWVTRFRWLGAGEFSLDGTTLILDGMKAHLLRILACNGGRQVDELVGWKCKAQIRRTLEELCGSASTPHGLDQLIYQLRVEFVKAGLDPDLIQSDSRLGRRLALRRPTAKAVEEVINSDAG